MLGGTNFVHENLREIPGAPRTGVQPFRALKSDPSRWGMERNGDSSSWKLMGLSRLEGVGLSPVPLNILELSPLRGDERARD